jgi:hypothetical protein
MTRADGPKFSKKHESGAQIDPVLRDRLQQKAAGGEVACALAFQVADVLETSPAEIGRALDLLELKLNKCQLGLFGYRPGKKIIQAKPVEDRRMETAIRNALVDGKLSCRAAWDIAGRFGVPKMAVSSACEALGIKIKPCQLGAF